MGVNIFGKILGEAGRTGNEATEPLKTLEGSMLTEDDPTAKFENWHTGVIQKEGNFKERIKAKVGARDYGISSDLGFAINKPAKDANPDIDLLRQLADAITYTSAAGKGVIPGSTNYGNKKGYFYDELIEDKGYFDKFQYYAKNAASNLNRPTLVEDNTRTDGTKKVKMWAFPDNIEYLLDQDWFLDHINKFDSKIAV